MPRFSQQPIGEQHSRHRGIPQELVEEYKPYIEGLEKGNEGILEFAKNEDMNIGRKALQEAATQMRTHVKVQKVRGEDNRLRFRQITKKEFDEAKRSAQQRGAKLRGRTRSSRS